MPDFILLKQKERCPQCRARRSFRTGHCSNCGMMIFIRPINFQQFENDGNSRRYWLWNSQYGYIYRDHVIGGLQPLERFVHFTNPEPNTKTAQERVQDIKKDTKKRIRERGLIR